MTGVTRHPKILLMQQMYIITQKVLADRTRLRRKRKAEKVEKWETGKMENWKSGRLEKWESEKVALKLLLGHWKSGKRTITTPLRRGGEALPTLNKQDRDKV